MAAIENHYEAFDSLIAKGCDPNYNKTAVDFYGDVVSNYTPLVLASIYQSMGSKDDVLALYLFICTFRIYGKAPDNRRD